MNAKEKKLIYWLIFVVAVFILILLLMPSLNNLTAPYLGSPTPEAAKTLRSNKGMASLLLVYPDKKRAFEGEIFDGMTVDDALIQAAQAGNFNYKINSFNVNKLDYTIDGLSFNDGKQWNCYLNDALVNPKLVTELNIKNGDKIVCKYY